MTGARAKRAFESKILIEESSCSAAGTASLPNTKAFCTSTTINALTELFWIKIFISYRLQ